MAKTASSTKAGKVYRIPQQDSSPTEPLSASPTQGEIAQEAYAIHLANGARDGRDVDDWLEAERLLQARSRTALEGQRAPDTTLAGGSTQADGDNGHAPSERSFSA